MKASVGITHALLRSPTGPKPSRSVSPRAASGAQHRANYMMQVWIGWNAASNH